MKKAKPKNQKAPEKKLEDTAYWGAIVAALIAMTIILGSIVAEQNNSNAQNAFTALFFNGYDKNAIGNTANFSFTIENHETKRIGYLADISIDSSLEKTVAFDLEPDQARTETVSLPFDFSNENSHKVSVRLRGRPEAISFWASAKK